MPPPDYTNSTLWGIHGGQSGDAVGIFLKKNQIALGWDEIGDLALLSPTREAFKQHVAVAYPGRKPGYYPEAAMWVESMSVENVTILSGDPP